MNKKALIPMAVLASLAIPGIAAAHNATATPSCGGLSWQATNYDKTVTNTITVTVDGTVVHQDLDFKASDSGAHSWSPSAAHTWSVAVNAPGTQYDKSFSGTWQACIAPTTTLPSSTTVVATTTVPPTTSVPDVATTVVTDPTTTVVAVDIPPVPTTVALDVVSLTPDEPVLPRTGVDQGYVIGIAFCLLVVGGFLLAFVARRRA